MLCSSTKAATGKGSAFKTIADLTNNYFILSATEDNVDKCFYFGDSNQNICWDNVTNLAGSSKYYLFKAFPITVEGQTYYAIRAYTSKQAAFTGIEGGNAINAFSGGYFAGACDETGKTYKYGSDADDNGLWQIEENNGTFAFKSMSTNNTYKGKYMQKGQKIVGESAVYFTCYSKTSFTDTNYSIPTWSNLSNIKSENNNATWDQTTRTITWTTNNPSLVGWTIEGGVDISSWNYLNVILAEPTTCDAQFCFKTSENNLLHKGTRGESHNGSADAYEEIVFNLQSDFIHSDADNKDVSGNSYFGNITGFYFRTWDGLTIRPAAIILSMYPIDSYNRTVTANNYGTLTLPQAGIIMSDGATVYNVTGKKDQTSLYIKNETENTLTAGKPYIFKSTSTDLKVALVGDVTTEASSNNGLHGVLNKTTATNGNYVLSNNTWMNVVTGAEPTIGANRAYLNLDEVSSGESSASSYVMDVNSGVVTGIDAMNTHKTVGAPMYYNLQGQRVMSPNTGMYIMNGKKVIIK